MTASIAPLLAPLSTLKGVGASLTTRLKHLLGGETVWDVLCHVPTTVVQREYRPHLKGAEAGTMVTLPVQVNEHDAPTRRVGRRPYRIHCLCGDDDVTLSFFNWHGDYLAKKFPVGARLLISGRLEKYDEGWQITHPDEVQPWRDEKSGPSTEVVYPLALNLTSKQVRYIIQLALPRVPDVPEWLDAAFIARQQWPTWRQALRDMHHPQSPDDCLPTSSARQRLAYDELLASQLALQLIRKAASKRKGEPKPASGFLTQKLLATLPFQLTDGQQSVWAEISRDMSSPYCMARLLQGDVGSGKTILALLAMLQAAENGKQAALLAPTEILARQHAATLNRFLSPLNMRVELLLGGQRAKGQKAVMAALATGACRLVVGTHALLTQKVDFDDLGLAVIDEQHRFGVEQRMKLASKGRDVDLLVMTATPIPRTLAMAVYGDMDISRLTEKPAGRQPITTRVMEMTKYDDLVAGLARQMALGAQIYWVCPQIGETDESDLAAATMRAEKLQEVLGKHKVGLVHGQQKAHVREATMQSFVLGHLPVLVATTVIEVGVHVPAATVMVIEHAERFGLAQLHQLRGRVGRGEKNSSCILLYHGRLSPTAQARLSMMRDTHDGFLIAEEDLRLRGAGEFLGTRQSGLPPMRFVDF
ncbi:MAG: ATP-dependent DNA helicase RecG, partial [Alphaproteobacteria bacterium]|nr:ATP-dependent DNA helicase RecG [Alphaproteobacteria bacterium]